MDYSIYTNKVHLHKKLGDFVTDQSSYGFGIDLRELLTYRNPEVFNGTSNAEFIYNSIYSEDKDLAKENKEFLDNVLILSDSQLNQIPFPLGTTILIPFSMVDKSLNVTNSNNFINSLDYECFLAQKLYDLLNEKQYRSDIKNKNHETISDIFANITVWVWSRSLSKKFKDDSFLYVQDNAPQEEPQYLENGIQTFIKKPQRYDVFEDVLVDITPFVYNLNTSVSENGGSFNFSVSPIPCEFKDGKWGIDCRAVKLGTSEYSADMFLHHGKGDDTLGKNYNFVSNILQQNDVVFIRFEKLELENDRTKDYSFEIDKSELPGKIYDMIGLIDNINESISGVDMNINISGRDLIKLFIEDGVYFYPVQFTKSDFFVNTGAGDEVLQRLGKNKEIISRYQYLEKSIDSTLKYIINALSNVKITSDTLFDSYSSRRTEIYKTESIVEENKKIEEGEKQAIELIKKSILFDNVGTIQGNEIQSLSENGNLLTDSVLLLHNDIKNFLIVGGLQEALIEVNSNLIGWNSFSGVYGSEVEIGASNEGAPKINTLSDFLRNRLFKESSEGDDITISNNKFAFQAVKKIYENIKNGDARKLNIKNLPVRGIWQIIKLVIDDSIGNRRIVDSSIGNEHGALLNAINKLCSKPFVEFYSDTYGDEFNLIVRKQPFDRESVVSFLDKRVNVKSDTTASVDFSSFNTIKQENNSIVIEINESDVINTNLSFEDTVYSWYRMELTNLGGGTSSLISRALLGAVYFKEFAEMYGSKPLDIPNNYTTYYPIVDKNDKVPNAYYIRQGLLDLKYLIESHAYLPFTRTGTIIINGNRTIKRGTFIKLASTNEIFYVDAVDNNFTLSGSIDRTTTLRVSRGMIEDYIRGVDINGVNYSYFNVCFLPINESVFNDNELIYTNYADSIASQWRVNRNVFNFFLKKFQFAPKEEVIKLINDGI